MFDWLTQFIEAWGLLAVFILMVLENVIPLIPSELIEPLAGYKAAEGSYPVVVAILVSATGSVLGSLVWYTLGKRLGKDGTLRFAERHGAWLTLEAKDVEKGLDFFHHHHMKAIILARLVPGLRTLIALPAGIMAIKLKYYLVLSFIGSVIWDSLLIYSGFLLKDRYDQVSHVLNPITNIILVGVLIIYIVRVIRHKRKHS
jgi:membrane protein DedA with SNARE-associated domain